MTFEERFEALTKLIELQAEAADKRGAKIDERLDRLAMRIDALTMNVELISRDVESLRTRSEQDAENIRALARIAEAHEHRLGDLEKGRA